MRYLCLVYLDEKEHPIEGLVDQCLTYAEELKMSGRYVTGGALQPVKTASSVRVRNGKACVTDGPFVETKEQLGGFYMVEAPNHEEAIRIASSIPTARLGTVEVRPLWEMEVS